MKNISLILLAIFTLTTIQNCATLEKTTEDKMEAKTKDVDEELLEDVQELKALLGGKPADTPKIEQPLEFGISVKAVQDLFPAPDKFEYDPMVNKKVTMLARDSGSGRFTFFFYEDKLYKIVIINKWSDFTIQFAEDNINNFIELFIAGYGNPDFAEADDMHQIMTWIKDDLEVKLEVFSLMSHSGIGKVLTLVYMDRNIGLLAKKDESFELYRTKRQDSLDQ